MKPRLTLIICCLATCCARPLIAATARPTPAPSTRPITKVALSQWARLQAASTLDQLQRDADFPAAKHAVADLFDQVVLHAPPTQPEAFREAAFPLRLITHLESAPPASRLDLLKYLRANPNLARTLALLIRPGDNPAGAYALLDRLRQQRAPMLESFATLAAAVCVVHDRPFQRRVNENSASADDPLKIFDYFAANEPRMFYKIRPVPAELLIYVVDTTASIDEMRWALNRYAGDPKVGARFFDIKYDHDHVRLGTPKRLTEEGFNLPNILQFGGVCADQAYFASTVGKSIGVPTAVASASAGQVGHAWVGFFQSAGRQGWWNFDIGRYAAYRGIRGSVLDPQLRQPIPDSYVSLLAELLGTTPDSRQATVALTDATLRLIQLEKTGKTITPPPLDQLIPTTVLAQPRKPATASQLELLESAVKHSPGDRACWFVVRDLAKDGRLSLDQKRRWASILEQICGPKYPDFALAMLTPMIQTIDQLPEQNKLWNEAFSRFSHRADLAAAIRMAQAALFESHNQHDEAGRCYMDVIERYANAGPFVIDALQKAESALVRTNRADRIPLLYAQTFSRIQRPSDTLAGSFVTQSNWYRVGKLYAEKLDQAGSPQAAATLRSDLEQRTGFPLQDR